MRNDELESLGQHLNTLGTRIFLGIIAAGLAVSAAIMLQSHDYVIHGEIDEKLQWTGDRGQVVSVRVDTPGGSEFVGIRIPVELAKLNLETRQKYSFKVNFQDGGIAVATGVNRL
jgi:hypothetical protein